ncbi:VOC family protein [Aureivirga sp. CE67]|uniref:VOC family protein n=1 Tax=Aureivirga sp. CE67 TaxID=1788983 RepID=UPI0018CA9DF4|nr:VOC family protein [Aureivirga sp. CE67]
MTLTGFTLQIKNPEKTIQFYTEILGMQLLKEEKKENIIFYDLSFPNNSFVIQLKFDEKNKDINYQQNSIDNYWKYSLFVKDIIRVYEQLQKMDYPIGEPFQFGKIGYLSHTQDIENHQIEFIQTSFKENTKPTEEDNQFFLKEPPILGLLTIRTKDPVKTIQLYENLFDMKLFVRMYVDRGNGFTLYFLGNKNLEAPSSDIDVIENREWMYQQNHLFVEIQYYWESELDSSFDLKHKEKEGLQTINFKGNTEQLLLKLEKLGISYEKNEDSISFKSYDDHVFEVAPF